MKTKLYLEDCAHCGEWMHINMMLHGLKLKDLEKTMHITRQTLSDYFKKKRDVPFGSICSFIYVLRLSDDPEEVYSYFYKTR